MKRTVIIGGGPSGLAAAYALQGETVVLEKQSQVGGLCRSIKHGNGVFDIGGHSFHTPFPDVYELSKDVLEDGLYEQTRDARVHVGGALIPYPYQKHFDLINDQTVVQECAKGLREAAGEEHLADNFEDYILRRFGKGIAEHFMLPYNRKLWARDIAGISCEWTSERVAGAKGDSEKFSTTGGGRKPLQSDTSVAYPAKGGFEEISKGLARKVPKVHTDCAIVRLNPKKKEAYSVDGRTFPWDVLISTMPVPELLAIIDEAPADLIELAQGLEYMSLRVELLLVDRPIGAIQRIYVADSEVPPHKIAFNHNSSQFLRERDCHAVMAEVSYSQQKPIDGDSVARKTSEFLVDMGIIGSPEWISWTSHVDVKYGYPVYTHKRPEILEAIKDWLESRDIHLLGRFGEWEYVNSDKCMMKGLKLGHSLREGKHSPEGARNRGDR